MKIEPEPIPIISNKGFYNQGTINANLPFYPSIRVVEFQYPVLEYGCIVYKTGRYLVME